MTRHEFNAALEAINWPAGRLATLLGCSRDLPIKWGLGTSQIPPVVADWLRDLAAAHAACPAPQNWRARTAKRAAKASHSASPCP